MRGSNITLDEKFRLSGDLILYEECPEFKPEDFIYSSQTRAKEIPILKLLLSNICENSCFYCANRRQRICLRYKFKPEEVIKLFNYLRERERIEGIFISSGLDKEPTKTQESILKIIEILRLKYNFKGYIHAKILPNANIRIVEQIVKFSNRISLNLEAPGERYLKEIAPDKDFISLFRRLKELSGLSKKYNLTAGVTTQIIVGIGNEDDRTLLTFSERLYRKYGLRRVYFSGFRPVKGTPLEKLTGCLSFRVLRLYQADFLIRKYGFEAKDLIYDLNGNLILDKDPKLIWAETKLSPVDINKSDFKQLIRIPGIGQEIANKILKYRRDYGRITLSVLKELGLKKEEVLKFVVF